MPVLSDGRKFGILSGLILEPGTDWFDCPPGHFWFNEPDPDFSRPPFKFGERVIHRVRHAPVPSDIDGLRPYIPVVEIRGEDYRLTGLYLDFDTKPRDWTDEDWALWRDFRESEQCRAFLAAALEKCQMQDAYNREVVASDGELPDDRWAFSLDGWVLVPESERTPRVPEDPAVVAARAEQERLSRMEGVVSWLVIDLESEVTAATQHNTPNDWTSGITMESMEKLFVLRARVKKLIASEYGRTEETLSLLGRIEFTLWNLDEAERIWRGLVQDEPSDSTHRTHLGLALFWKANEAEAEEQARKAVELDPDHVEGWRLLAGILAKGGREDEFEHAKARLKEAEQKREQWRALLEPVFGRRGKVAEGSAESTASSNEGEARDEPEVREARGDAAP